MNLRSRYGFLRGIWLVLATTGLASVSCAQKRATDPDPIDPSTAARLGLTDDARDPTLRDKEAGYYKWKEKPEPTGTEDPTSPDRRRIGGPNSP